MGPVSNTTTKYWDLDGVSLNQFAWNIKSRGGSRRGTASPRGENRTIPHRYGRRYVPKYRDSRIIALPMWVRGSENDGSEPADGDNAKKFDENWDILANLFDFEGQKPLTKRWLEAGQIKSATAMVEYSGGLDPDVMPGDRADFAPELLLADPWFYEAEALVAAFSGSQTITVRGNKPTDRVGFTFTDGTNPRIAWGADRYIQLNLAMTGQTRFVVVKERYVHDGAGTYLNSAISRDRTSPDWGILDPGSTTFTVTGGGTVAINYQPAFR